MIADRNAIRAKAIMKRLRLALSKMESGNTLLDSVLEGSGYGDDLVNIVPLDKRGLVPVGLYLSGAPPFVVREALLKAWTWGHFMVARTARAEGDCLFKMFRYAEFDIPADLPDQVPIWRATIGLNRATAERGFSWTTRRMFACWWLRGLGSHGFKADPLLIRAVVPRSSIVFYQQQYSGGDEPLRSGRANSLRGEAER